MLKHVKIDNSSKRLGYTQTLNQLQLDIGGGKVFGLLGPNGAGNMPLIRHIMVIIKPDSGYITLFGKHHPGTIHVRQLIGYMLLQIFVYPSLSVLENILFFGRMYKMDETYLPQRANEVLKIVD